MYNRYIPQADGSFRRNRVQDPQKEQERTTMPLPITGKPEQSVPTESCRYYPVKASASQYHKPKPPVQNTGVISFLKHLLPKEFDAEDLLVVLLLLLMTGDSREDQNSALLTLMLYFFL